MSSTLRSIMSLTGLTTSYCWHKRKPAEYPKHQHRGHRPPKQNSAWALARAHLQDCRADLAVGTSPCCRRHSDSWRGKPGVKEGLSPHSTHQDGHAGQALGILVQYKMQVARSGRCCGGVVMAQNRHCVVQYAVHGGASGYQRLLQIPVGSVPLLTSEYPAYPGEIGVKAIAVIEAFSCL